MPDSSPRHRALRVLIVDDDEDTRWLLRDALSGASCPCDVREAESGERALELLLSVRIRPDLMLLDIEMSGMTGLMVLDRIRSERQFAKLPVAMISGSGISSELRREALARGADAFVTKTYDLARTFESVLRAVDAIAAGKPLAEAMQMENMETP